jgi:molybdate transport system substrate-binding protein
VKAKLIITAASALLMSNIVQAAEINVLSSNAIRQAYLELVPQFEKSSGHTVRTIWAGTNDIVKRIAAGETYDLIIMSADALEKLVKDGTIMAGTRVNLVKSGVGVAVKAGAPKPDLSSGDAVKKALIAAKSVGYSSGPSGVYLQSMFAKMGIADELKIKSKQTQPGTPVANIIRSGEAELGFQQVSELVHEKGIDYIGPLPADIQHLSLFAGGVHKAAKQPDAAKALTKFLTDPSIAPVIKKHGLEPG